jgi:hypothetical protein
LTDALAALLQEWKTKGLPEKEKSGTYTTEACIKELCSLVRV